MRMKATAANTMPPARATAASRLPPGVVILGLAAASWMVLATAWVGMSQLFGLVAAAL